MSLKIGLLVQVPVVVVMRHHWEVRKATHSEEVENLSETVEEMEVRRWY